MALVDVKPLIFPYHYNAKNDTSNSNTMDSTTDRQAVIFVVPKTGNISAIGFFIISAGTPQSVDIRLETVDTSTGVPTGTLQNSPTNTTLGTQGTIAANTYYEPTLTAAAAVTAGQTLAAVLQFTSTGGVCVPMSMDIIGGSLNMPYGAYNLTGSYAKSNARALNIILKYDDGAYYEIGTMPALSSNTLSTAYNSGSSPSERGIKFTLPVPATVDGFWFGGSFTAGATADVVLYASDGTTTLASTSLDGDVYGGATSGGYFYGRFGSPQNLTANTAYRLTLKPTNTTNSNLWQFTFNSTSIMNAISGGSNVFLTTKTGGSWDDTATTTRAWIGLVITALDNGAGGSGGAGSSYAMWSR